VEAALSNFFTAVMDNGATTFSITTFSIMTLSIMTLNIMKLSIMTLSIMTPSTMGLIATVGIIDTLHKRHSA
jgi:hypothetical protein